jgi:hypothetical protein
LHGTDGTGRTVSGTLRTNTLCVQRAGDQQQQVWIATTGQHSNDVRWSSCFAMGEPVVRNPFTLNEEEAQAVRNPFTLNEEEAQAVLKLQRSIFAFALSEIEWTHTHDAKVSVSALSSSLDTPSRWPSRTCVHTRAHTHTHTHTPFLNLHNLKLHTVCSLSFKLTVCDDGAGTSRCFRLRCIAQCNQ